MKLADEIYALLSEYVAEQDLSPEEKRTAWKIVHMMISETLNEPANDPKEEGDSNGIGTKIVRQWNNAGESRYDEQEEAFLESEIEFGKHQGETWGEVDIGYLEWCADNFEDGSTLRMIEKAIELREREEMLF